MTIAHGYTILRRDALAKIVSSFIEYYEFICGCVFYLPFLRRLSIWRRRLSRVFVSSSSCALHNYLWRSNRDTVEDEAPSPFSPCRSISAVPLGPRRATRHRKTGIRINSRWSIHVIADELQMGEYRLLRVKSGFLV